MWYEIDAVDRLAKLCPSWEDVATRFGTQSLKVNEVLGRSIWTFLEGDTVICQYARIFETVRQSRQRVEMRIRSDGPGRQSLMRVAVLPLQSQTLRVEVETIRDRAVPIRPLWDPRRPRSAARVRACSWCKSIEVAGEWHALPKAEALRTDLNSTCPPVVVHDICPHCIRSLGQEHSLAIAQGGRRAA